VKNNYGIPQGSTVQLFLFIMSLLSSVKIYNAIYNMKERAEANRDLEEIDRWSGYILIVLKYIRLYYTGLYRLNNIKNILSSPSQNQGVSLD